MLSRAFLCAIGMLLLHGATIASAPESARTFLATTFGMTAEDLSRIETGQVVSRTLGAHEPREVATLGVVRIKATPDFYVEGLRDIASFKRDEAVVQIGAFSNPPQINDVAGLTLEAWDVDRLRECRINDCGLQLPADAIGRFNKEMDWRRGDSEQQASRVMRQILVEYVTRYRDSGTTPAMQYVDQSRPLVLSDEFRALVDADAGTWQHFPGLRRHLLEYPKDTPGTTDIVYWSKERVSRRLVVSVTHLAIARAMSGPAAYAIASKQIYSSHYFDASLGLTVLVPDAGHASAMYVVYLNRSRVDVFKGMFGGIARRIVTTRARTLVSDLLSRLQRRIERDYTAAGH
jgi:hypothetical protein